MNRKLLIIKPRWYPNKELVERLEALRIREPEAQITVLTDSPDPAAGYSSLRMPSLRPSLSLLSGLLKLWRNRYDEVQVLADPARLEHGYLEAKIWAFASRTRVRRLGDIKQLSFWYELTDKWRRGAVQAPVLAFLWILKTRERLQQRRHLERARRIVREGAEPVTSCPVCGGDLSRGPALEYTQDFLRCPDCGTLYLSYRPSLESLSRIYNDTYYTGEQHRGYEEYDRWAGRRRLEAFVYLHQHDRLFGPRRGRFLDVGCALGYFPEVAGEQGWQAEGIEFSEWAVRQAQSRGLNVQQGDFLAIEKTGAYAFITLMDVVEHLRDPLSAFQKVHKLLEPGGHCVIRLPEPEKQGKGSPHLDDVTHIWFPSEAAVRQLAGRAKLVVLSAGPTRYDDRASEYWLQRPAESSS